MPPAQTTQEMPACVSQSHIDNALEDTVKEVVQDPDEVLKMIKGQYQDALYASKVRLSSCAPTILNTDSSSSPLWHILRKGPCLELELLSTSTTALLMITQV